MRTKSNTKTASPNGTSSAVSPYGQATPRLKQLTFDFR